MKHWRKLAALCLAGVLVFALAACVTENEGKSGTEAPTEDVEPTTDGSEVLEGQLPVVDPEAFKDYIGTWYADGSSAGYRIIVKDTATWELTDASEETIYSGNLRVNEEDDTLELYDPDGSLGIVLTMEEAGRIHADVQLETLIDTLSTNYFYNEITNDNADAPPSAVDDSAVDAGPTDNSSAVEPPYEETPAV